MNFYNPLNSFHVFRSIVTRCKQTSSTGQTNKKIKNIYKLNCKNHISSIYLGLLVSFFRLDKKNLRRSHHSLYRISSIYLKKKPMCVLVCKKYVFKDKESKS